MSPKTESILKLSAQRERYEHRERADYDLNRFEEEFKQRLYSDKGRQIVSAWAQRQSSQAAGKDR